MNETGRNACRLIAIAAGILAAYGPAQAQDSGKVMIDAAQCMKLETAEARLACYESRAAQAAPARPAEPSPAANAPAATAPAAATAAATAPVATTTAATAPAAPAAAAVPSQPAPSAPPRARRAARDTAPAEQIVSRVKEFREFMPSSYMITLENGQVWRQTYPQEYPLRPGLQVRIYGTRWGSASRLSADELKGYIQVVRVR